MNKLTDPNLEAKQEVDIYLSPDVLSYFKATGKGWQTRIDEVLKEWVESHPS